MIHAAATVTKGPRLKSSYQARQSTHLFAILPSSSPASKTPSQTVRETHKLQEKNCCVPRARCGAHCPTLEHSFLNLRGAPAHEGTSKSREKAAPQPVVVPSTLVMCQCARVLCSARHYSTCIDPAKEERLAALFALWVQEVGSHRKYEPGADDGSLPRRRFWRYSALQGTESYRGLISDKVFLLHESNR